MKIVNKIIILLATAFSFFSCNEKKSTKAEMANVKVSDTMTVSIPDVDLYKDQLAPGEMFLTNIPDDSIYWKLKGDVFYPTKNVNALQRYFSEIGYKTKRLGKISYNEKGNIIKNMRPVFVSEKELIDELGKWLDKEDY